MGVCLDIRLFTDATTGKSIASRKGLGKVRHISVNELWIQDKVASKVITIIKIKNKFNPADLMTKDLSKDEIRQIMDGLCHLHSEGRNADAPELSIIEEHWRRTFPEQMWRGHIFDQSSRRGEHINDQSSREHINE